MPSLEAQIAFKSAVRDLLDQEQRILISTERGVQFAILSNDRDLVKAQSPAD